MLQGHSFIKEENQFLTVIALHCVFAKSLGARTSGVSLGTYALEKRDQIGDLQKVLV